MVVVYVKPVTVKGRSSINFAKSGWMEIEKKRGISAALSVG